MEAIDNLIKHIDMLIEENKKTIERPIDYKQINDFVTGKPINNDRTKNN